MLVGFSGTQCCGKSTLLRHLKEKNPDWNIILGEEGVVRKLKNEYGIKLNQEGDLTTQTLIMSQHIQNILKYQNTNTMVDRCVLDSFVYSTHQACKKLDSFDAYWFSQQIFQRYWKKYQIIFLLSYEEVPFEEDGVRSEDLQYRRDIHELFLMAVEHYKMHNVVHLGGSVEERLKIIKSTFDNIEI